MNQQSGSRTTRSGKHAQSMTTNADDDRFAKDWRFELLALGGFFLSGLFFIAASIRSQDMVSLVGSITWTVSCAVWMIPYRKYRKRCPRSARPGKETARTDEPRPSRDRATASDNADREGGR